MARMKGAGRKPGSSEYHSGPANTPVYVFVDGITGETRWCTDAPMSIRVTDEELNEMKDEDGYIGSNGVKQLCDYHDRVRVVEADDMSTTRSRVAGLPALPGDFNEAQLNDFHEACSEMLTEADWGHGCDKCARKCGRCEALETRERNAGMALSFMRMSRTSVDSTDRDAYDTASRCIALLEHPVRSSKDFKALEGNISKPKRDSVNELIDQHAVHGNFKREYEDAFTKVKLRIGKEGSRSVKYISVLTRPAKDTVFCPDAETADLFAQLAGLDKKAKYCSQCAKPRKFTDEEKSGPFAQKFSLWPYVREVQHGYYVVSLDDLETEWSLLETEVGEEEAMWEVRDPFASEKGSKWQRR